MAIVIVAGNDGWQNKEVKRGGNQHSDKQKVQNSATLPWHYHLMNSKETVISKLLDEAEYDLINHGDRGGYFPSQKTFWDATTCFFAKRLLKDERRNSIWLILLIVRAVWGNLLQSIRGTTQIWVVTPNGWFSGSCGNQFPYQSGQIFLIWTLAKVDSAGTLTLFHSLNEALLCSIVFF